MNAKTFSTRIALRLSAAAMLAFAGSAAMADSVTLVTEGGASVAARADVRAEVLATTTTGYTIHIGQAGTLEAVKSPVSVAARSDVKQGGVLAQRVVDVNYRG